MKAALSQCTIRAAASMLCCVGALITVPVVAVCAQQAGGSNVPDTITRKTGLRVSLLPHPAKTYAENCAGCHGTSGVSVTEIPTLAGRIGYFARSPEGRRYLVQVPNVALNPSSDEDIAELMNWLLASYSRSQLPENFAPYSAAEVSSYRRQHIDVAAERRRIVEQLFAAGQLPSRDALSIPPSALY
jgi:mono/diheme cytochrome c family protein